MKKYMRQILVPVLTILVNSMACGQPKPNFNLGQYEANEAFPYGRLNPDAPPETKQFDFMVGTCDCQDSLQNPVDGQWYSFKTIWNAKYIMNGYAIQDVGWNPIFSPTSIRVFNTSKQLWEVTYFQMPNYQTGTWTGSKEGDNMVMKKTTKGPNGASGESRLTFYDITESGFKWKSEFFGEDGSYTSGWRIICTKRK